MASTDVDCLTVISEDTLAQHRSSSDGWIAIQGMVYDLTDYCTNHPGGDVILSRHFGTDATQAFESQKSHSVVKRFIQQELSKRIVGRLG